MIADFTLILITKDRADISKCLNSIFKNMKKIEFKLVIIDGNKNDLLLNQIKNLTLSYMILKFINNVGVAL